jgi:hypothetical protein
MLALATLIHPVKQQADKDGKDDKDDKDDKPSTADHDGATLLQRSGLRSALLDNQVASCSQHVTWMWSPAALQTSSLSPEELQDELTKDMLGLAKQMKHQAAITNELLLTGNTVRCIFRTYLS